MNCYAGFSEAYRAILGDLRANGSQTAGVVDATSIGSNFGLAPRATREMLAVGFQVNDPRRRLVRTDARRLSSRFLVANLLWTVAGGHDVDMIASYNSKARLFARDESYFEAAFGSRLFSPGNQFRMAERRLKADTTSRRASAMIYLAEDSIVERRDVPCALVLQFLIRDNHLTCITIMRSQSAAMVMPYDVFLFSMIQEALAVRLGVELGPYIHFANSMHYYEDEAETVDAILGSDLPEVAAMPRMCRADDRAFEELVNAERSIRAAARALHPTPPVDVSTLDEYWQRFLEPLLIEPPGGHPEGSYWNAV